MSFFIWKIKTARLSCRQSAKRGIRQRKADIELNSTEPLLKKRGRKQVDFHNLTERTKKKYSNLVARKHSLEELLLAAETAAYKKGSHATKKILKLLRNGGEKWAKEAASHSLSKTSTSHTSIERSLMLKTRLSLSKNKYNGISKFLRQDMGQKLASWKEIMAFRNTILPAFPSPNDNKGYLSVTVPVREMVTKDLERILELEEV